MLAAGAEAVVLAGVAGQHPLAPLHDVIEDRLADVILSSSSGRLARAAHAGLEPPVSASNSMMQPRSASTHSKISSMIRLSNWSMSSVWLTARAVRYITWRLLRALASQEFCGKSACASNSRLPSF